MAYNPFNPITKIIASKITSVIKPTTPNISQPKVLNNPNQEVRPRIARPLIEPTRPKFTGLAFGEVNEDIKRIQSKAGGNLPRSKFNQDRIAEATKKAYTKPGFYSTYNWQTKKYELRPIPGREREVRAIDKILSRFNFRTSQYQFKDGRSLRATGMATANPKKKSSGERIATAGALIGGVGLLNEATGFLNKGLSGLDPGFVNQPASLNPSITNVPSGSVTVGSTGGGKLIENTVPASPDSFYPGEGGLNDAIAKGTAKAGEASPTTPSFGRRPKRSYGYGGEFIVRPKTKPTIPTIKRTGLRNSGTAYNNLPNKKNQFKISWL